MESYNPIFPELMLRSQDKQNLHILFLYLTHKLHHAEFQAVFAQTLQDYSVSGISLDEQLKAKMKNCCIRQHNYDLHIIGSLSGEIFDYLTNLRDNNMNTA